MHTHTNTLVYTYTHMTMQTDRHSRTLTLSLTLSLTHSHTHSPSNSHTHTHTHTNSHSLTYAQSLRETVFHRSERGRGTGPYDENDYDDAASINRYVCNIQQHYSNIVLQHNG